MNTTPTGETIQNLVKESRGKVVASFDLISSSGIRIPGFTLVNGKNGLFISTPSRPTPKGWQPLVYLPSYIRKSLEELVIREFHNLSKPREKEKQPAWKPPLEFSHAGQKEIEYLEWKKTKTFKNPKN